MIPSSLPSGYEELTRIHACMQSTEGANLIRELFHTPQVATIISIPRGPLGKLQEAWKGVKCPFLGTHGGEGLIIQLKQDEVGVVGGEIKHGSEALGGLNADSSVAITSLALATLHAISKNLPDEAQAKYDLYQMWSSTAWAQSNGAWVFNSLNPGENLYSVSDYKEGVDPYVIEN